jgi:hypothetical protein
VAPVGVASQAGHEELAEHYNGFVGSCGPVNHMSPSAQSGTAQITCQRMSQQSEIYILGMSKVKLRESEG